MSWPVKGPRRRDLHIHLGVLLSGTGAAPITCIRVVQPDDIDYSKVREVGKLTEKIRGGLAVGEATRAFDRIQEAPHRYPQWVAMIGNAGVTAGAALLFTTSWKIILATFVTGLIVDRMLAAMEHCAFRRSSSNLPGRVHHSGRCGDNRGSGSRRPILRWRRPNASRRGWHHHARRGA